LGDDTFDGLQTPHHRSRRRSGWFVALIVIGVLCVAAVALYVPVVATSTSSYCSSCKVMKPAYESWRRSAHSTVQCVQCHVPPGVVASLKWRAKETRNIWADYLNMKPGAQREPFPASRNCTKCHPLKGLMGIPGKLRMPHATHMNLNNLTCVDCHDHTAHAPKGTSSAVSMSPCTMCHEQTTDPKRCSFCHYTPPTEGKAHPGDYIKAHGQLALENEQDCLRCHHNKAEFCDGCHAKPPPGHYSGDWRYSHGLQAVKDRSRCYGCHSYEDLCKQCHEVSHPADWADSHAPVAAKGSESCLVCHPRLMCIDCHRAKGVQTP
jgi:nitrate/TMAO reductase-like tetraheme cytochrome c subunit